MGIKAVWGFDPDEVAKAQALFCTREDESSSSYGIADEIAARIPDDLALQIYELRRIFRL